MSLILKDPYGPGQGNLCQLPVNFAAARNQLMCLIVETSSSEQRGAGEMGVQGVVGRVTHLRQPPTKGNGSRDDITIVVSFSIIKITYSALK